MKALFFKVLVSHNLGYYKFIALCTAQAQNLNLDVNTVWMNMIRSGIGINVKDDLGNTVLHYAMTNYMKNNDVFTATPRFCEQNYLSHISIPTK